MCGGQRTHKSPHYEPRFRLACHRLPTLAMPSQILEIWRFFQLCSCQFYNPTGQLSCDPAAWLNVREVVRRTAPQPAQHEGIPPPSPLRSAATRQHLASRGDWFCGNSIQSLHFSALEPGDPPRYIHLHLTSGTQGRVLFAVFSSPCWQLYYVRPKTLGDFRIRHGFQTSAGSRSNIVVSVVVSRVASRVVILNTACAWRWAVRNRHDITSRNSEV